MRPISGPTLPLGCLLVLWALVFVACHVPSEGHDGTRQLVQLLNDHSGDEYSKVCQGSAQDDLESSQAGRYIDPEFRVLKLRGHAPAPGQTSQTQDGLLEEIRKGSLRMAVVVARGGMGKSSLAKSFGARACPHMPVFSLDANEDILPAMEGLAKGDNAIIRRIRELSGLPDEPEERAKMEALLKSSPWLLLVDSLDELGLKDRPRALRQLKEVLGEYANGLHLIIFARPPVFASAYELAGVDSMFKIKDLDCARVEERIRAASPSLGGENRFWDFAADLGISRRVLDEGTCVFPQMSTYRDINVALSVALGADLSKSRLSKSPHQTATRSALYGHYVDQTLKHVSSASGQSVDTLRGLIRKSVEKAKPNAYTRDVAFNDSGCVALLTEAGVEAGVEVCTELFSSRLFKKSGEDGTWRFSNQSVMDYFLAEWMNRSLSVDGVVQCERVTEMWRLFESNEVAGFLVGMDNGGKCLPDVFMQLCVNGANFGDTLNLMDQGLSPGLNRVGILSDVRERAKDKLSNRCFNRLTTGLKPGAQQSRGL